MTAKTLFIPQLDNRKQHSWAVTPVGIPFSSIENIIRNTKKRIKRPPNSKYTSWWWKALSSCWIAVDIKHVGAATSFSAMVFCLFKQICNYWLRSCWSCSAKGGKFRLMRVGGDCSASLLNLSAKQQWMETCKFTLTAFLMIHWEALCEFRKCFLFNTGPKPAQSFSRSGSSIYQKYPLKQFSLSPPCTDTFIIFPFLKFISSEFAQSTSILKESDEQHSYFFHLFADRTYSKQKKQNVTYRYCMCKAKWVQLQLQ